MQMTKLLFAVTAILLLGARFNIIEADVIPFDLQGTGGTGLSPGSEHPATTGGSGGEIGAGISFDNVSLQLTINIGWGSGNGFTNLTGDATVGHIHGPTLDPAPTSFTEDASPLITLSSLVGWNANAASGGFSGTVSIPSGNVSDLLAGKLYINVHTAANSGGEIRGYLIAVPEPNSAALLLTGIVIAAVLPFWRRARKS